MSGPARRAARISLAALLIASAGCSPGKDPATQIDALMRPYTGAVPGASVLVLRDGVAIFRRAYGLANLEARIAAAPATNYRLASMTKQFTAAAVLLLVEQGRLTLDDPVRKWLPSLPAAAEHIRIRHLLTHTSGLIDYEDVIPDATAAQLHDADVLRLLETENRTYFAPGTQYRYSNSGYALLALIVGRASGSDFATFLRERIFHPLRMQNTVAFEDGISSVVNRAYGYSVEGNAWQRTDQSLTSAVLGDGGVYSSIDDLARWDGALYDNRLLRAESLWHSGETLGFRNVIVRFPTHRFTVVVLTNRDDPEPYFLALAIAKLFLPSADAVHAAHAAAGPDSDAHPQPPSAH